MKAAVQTPIKSSGRTIGLQCVEDRWKCKILTTSSSEQRWTSGQRRFKMSIETAKPQTPQTRQNTTKITEGIIKANQEGWKSISKSHTRRTNGRRRMAVREGSQIENCRGDIWGNVFHAPTPSKQMCPRSEDVELVKERVV